MSLREAQAAFAAALLNPDTPVPPGIGGPGGRADARRFAVYRNNVMVGLVDALAARFPVCAQLVGEEFFRAMARVHAAATKPRSPLLMAYGDDFPDFIAAFPPAAGLPYLADVARLEVAYGAAYHAAEAAPVTTAALGPLSPDRLSALRLSLHPSARLIRSAYPVASIWLAHQGGDAVEGPAEWVGEDVLVVRPDADVLVHRLPEGGFAFLDELRGGRTVGEAAGAACRDGVGFDLGGALVGLFAMGAVVAASPS
ncbi:DNA-binding domain-containing protein [Xanthobacter sp. V3C-3]|uniref:HvfC/BufC family peptide modification chaperone n=1 Tax=Xanthobacter lutulentifluminis TaxID=3119935 RepID=UPI00372736B5